MISTRQMEERMKPLQAVNMLEPEIRAWLLRNVKLQHEDEKTYAELTDKGYKINLGNDFAKFSPEQQKVVLLHEISHILRGDCLPKGKADKDPQLVNICMDAIINCSIPSFEDVFDVSAFPYYWKLQEQLPSLPSTYIPSWPTIYEAFPKEGLQMKAFDDPPKNESKDRDKAEAVHAKAVLEARKVKDLSSLAGNSLIAKRTPSPVKAVSMPPWARLLQKVKKHIKRNGFGSLVHVRTYNRPGRVEGLRGSARQPKLTISVILDISGSCSHLEPLFRGLATTLKRQYNVSLGVFASDFAQVKSPSDTADVGYGTAIRPVMAGLDKIKPDLAVIITDGEFMDELVLPRCPVWFVIYGSDPSWSDQLRPKDKIIKGEE